MIRFILVAATVILFLILSIPVIIFEWLTGKRTAASGMSRVWRWFNGFSGSFFVWRA